MLGCKLQTSTLGKLIYSLLILWRESLMQVQIERLRSCNSQLKLQSVQIKTATQEEFYKDLVDPTSKIKWD